MSVAVAINTNAINMWTRIGRKLKQSKDGEGKEWVPIPKMQG